MKTEKTNNFLKKIKTKCKSFGMNIKKTITVKEITFASMIMALWIICRTFLTIDLKATQENWTYIWMILIGLIFKPIIGIPLGIVSDTISLALGKWGLSHWTWSFALLPIVIYLITYSLRRIFTTKNDKLWWITSITTFAITILFTFILLLVRNNMTIGEKFNLGDTTVKIVVWISWAIMASVQISLLITYKIKKNDNIRWFISSYSIVSIIVVVAIWIWGPINMYIWFETYDLGPLPGYDILLFSRIAKSPIIIPIYTYLVASIYKVYIILNQNQKNSKW